MLYGNQMTGATAPVISFDMTQPAEDGDTSK
jgi:hypothetical protein